MNAQIFNIEKELRFFKKYLTNIQKDITETRERIWNKTAYPQNNLDVYTELLSFYFTERKNVKKKIIELRVKKYHYKH